MEETVKPKQRRTPVPARLLRDPGHLLALGLGLGASPLLPGTLGSLLAFPLYLLLQPLAVWQSLLVVAVLAAAGIYLCGRTARALDHSDPGAVVWDEVVGCLLVLVLVPSGWHWLLLGFVLFRCFDMTKPWPVSWADRQVPGGTGIMLDDLLASVYAVGLTWGVAWMGGHLWH